MQRIHREQARKYAFDFRDEPLLRVTPGESFEIETYDASTGFFKTAEDKAIPGKRPGFDRTPALANPIAGPIFVDGAEKGDTLVVTIEDILVDDYSWVAVGPRRGPLGESTRWPELSSEYTTKIFPHTPGPSGTTRDGTMRFNDKITWPITPFIGTLGVCPDREVTTSLDGQGEWGGNLDIRDVAPGNRIHLPVFHPGALFCLGDVHASQGDTEFSGTAAETKATTRIKFDLIKGRKTPWMRIDKPDSIIAIHASRPLEVAVETATIDPTRLLRSDARALPLPEWVEAIGNLRGSPAQERAQHLRRLEVLPLPLCALALHQNHCCVATGLAVVEGGWAGLFDIAVDGALRRQGLGLRMVNGLLHAAWELGARQAYLQVGSDNGAARSLYARFGFAQRYPYWYRCRPA